MVTAHIAARSGVFDFVPSRRPTDRRHGGSRASTAVTVGCVYLYCRDDNDSTSIKVMFIMRVLRTTHVFLAGFSDNHRSRMSTYNRKSSSRLLDACDSSENSGKER